MNADIFYMMRNVARKVFIIPVFPLVCKEFNHGGHREHGDKFRLISCTSTKIFLWFDKIYHGEKAFQEMNDKIGASGKSLSSGRIGSIDAFRGLTILTMIFVNDLAGIRGVPAWMKHAPGNANAMTFVDVVFPAFLFIVGMSIPFALRKRLSSGESLLSIWGHILLRTVGLLILGVYMVNMEYMDWKHLPISGHLWTALFILSVIAIWNRYPRGSGRRWFVWTLRILGFSTLIFLAYVYCGREGNKTVWMRTSWWGILGLIGWAYLTSATAYIFFRRQISAMMGVLGLLVLLNVGDRAGAMNFMGVLKEYLWFGGQIGGHSSITVAGVIVSMLFLEDSPARTPAKRILWILLFGAGLYAAGFLLYPLYGISKNNATPTWCLYCSGICCFIYAFLYWLMDLRKIKSWAVVVNPAGANPLLAYILPDLFYAVIALAGITWLRHHLNAGMAGIVRAFVFAFLMLGLTAILSRLKIVLRL